MKDLMVNFIGAVVFSIIGYSYVKTRKKTGLASKLIPRVIKPENIEDPNLTKESEKSNEIAG
jgi:hypothetical protein